MAVNKVTGIETAGSKMVASKLACRSKEQHNVALSLHTYLSSVIQSPLSKLYKPQALQPQTGQCQILGTLLGFSMSHPAAHPITGTLQSQALQPQSIQPLTLQPQIEQPQALGT